MTPMWVFLHRTSAIAAMVLTIDELVKTVARLRVSLCPAAPQAPCDRLELLGPLWLVHTANAGSALGFRQGWGLWVVLAAAGTLLIALYARWLQAGGWLASIAVGLQVGGALGNVLDRVVLGDASDVLYVGGGLIWNVADMAIGVGMLLATWALVRRRYSATPDTVTARSARAALH
jgi:signal peptidase II